MNREYPERPIASAAAVILREREVLLVRRGYPPREGIWTFPGGAVEVGETARQACAREVLEETGLHVRVGAVVEAVDVMQPEDGRFRYHYTILDFLAEPLVAGEVPRADTDAADARWVSVDAVEPYALTPEMLHVLRRALWLRDAGAGECLSEDSCSLI